jgi:asparaginyl-tRNA synthetase
MFQLTTVDPYTQDVKNVPENDFFGKPAFMSVSGQLEGETLALGRGEIYTFGPIFRADPSETPRHVAEFWMVEPEMAFYDFDDLLVLIEEFMKAITAEVQQKCSSEIAFLKKSTDTDLNGRMEAIRTRAFARITFEEAYHELMKVADRFTIAPDMVSDLATEHEKYLTHDLFGGPVFITDYPASFKPFYMKVNDGGKTVRAVDLLIPEMGEIVGGSQREERLDVLESRAREMGLDLKTYDWYLQTRRWGTAPHSGFGLGFDRMVSYLTGMKNLRDVLPYPRCKGQMY